MIGTTGLALSEAHRRDPERPARLTNRLALVITCNLCAAAPREGSLTALCPVDHFACDRCASPSITFPDEIHDAAELHCAGCGVGLGAWYAFKERTRQIILREIHRGEISAACASSDFPIHLLER